MQLLYMQSTFLSILNNLLICSASRDGRFRVKNLAGARRLDVL